MKRFYRLKNSGLSMFRKAIENLEKSSEMMLKRKEENCKKIDKLTNESSELDESRLENERIVENIKNIIGA
jgi:hypothetical protein